MKIGSASATLRARASRRPRRSPSAAIVAAGVASVLSFSVAVAVAALDPAAGLPAMLAAGLVASLLAAGTGFYAASQRAPADPQPCDPQDIAESASQIRWRLFDDDERYLRILDQQDELIELRHSDGRLAFANRAYRQTFEIADDERGMAPLGPPDVCADADGDRRQLLELLSTSAGRRWIAWRERAVAIDGGPSARLRVGRDVTDDRRERAELAQDRQKAERANKAKSKFLASMSHEIRTPMNGILGMTSLLTETKLSDQQRCYARAIDDSARALIALIDEILDLSKIEAGRLELSQSPFSIRGCVSRCIELLQPRADVKSLALNWSVDDGVPDVVVGDEARLRQILLNLLSNAIKFTDAGSVRLNAYATGSPTDAKSVRLCIEVIDTGIGFTAESLSRLFEEFDQGDAGFHRRQGGAGLGLAISRRLARAMGGDVTAEGAEGQGAVFRITARFSVSKTALPALQNGDVVSRAAHAPELPPLRVLIAEDNAINALLARSVLEKLGADVVMVADGAAALREVRKVVDGRANPFDLIMMDMIMPVMDGLQACRAVLNLYGSNPGSASAAPPIIALTANAYPEDRERCLAAGMSDYLAKPFDAFQLQQVIEKWVSGKTAT